MSHTSWKNNTYIDAIWSSLTVLVVLIRLSTIDLLTSRMKPAVKHGMPIPPSSFGLGLPSILLIPGVPTASVRLTCALVPGTIVVLWPLVLATAPVMVLVARMTGLLRS